MEYDNTNRGVLFKNEEKLQDTHADYNGTINIDGDEYWLNAWIKEAKSGKKFMSLSVKRKEQQRAPKPPKDHAAPQPEDDVPFN